MSSFEKAELFYLTNYQGITVICTNLGASIFQILVPDKYGKIEDITLNFDTLNELQNNDLHPYYGCTVGRVANRIANAKFTLEGNGYDLAANNGPNHLHGGLKGFDRKLWKVVRQEESLIEFEYFSSHLEENYPGNLTVNVTYELLASNDLTISMKATTDSSTIVNLTNHTYWNLSGSRQNTILDHELELSCAKYLPVNDVQIPTGELLPVKGTPFDFTTSRVLKSQILTIDGGGENGLDHCYVIDDSNADDKSLHYAAILTDQQSGRRLIVSTTQPGVQVYTANFLSKSPEDFPHIQYNGICLETQHFPDAINQSSFPSIVITPDSPYSQEIMYSFRVI